MTRDDMPEVGARVRVIGPPSADLLGREGVVDRYWQRGYWPLLRVLIDHPIDHDGPGIPVVLRAEDVQTI